MSDATSESRSESQVAVDVALDRVAMTAMAWAEFAHPSTIRKVREGATSGLIDEFAEWIDAVIVAQDAIEAAKPTPDPWELLAELEPHVPTGCPELVAKVNGALAWRESQQAEPTLSTCYDVTEPEPVPGADGHWVQAEFGSFEWALDEDGDFPIRQDDSISLVIYGETFRSMAAALDARETGADQ